LGFSLFSTAQAQNTPTLNIILGIDISGSHYSSNPSNDAGFKAMSRDADRSTDAIDEAQARPTDPNNIRYDSATSILSWLGVNQASLGVRMNINLVSFAETATTWENDWTPITAFADPDFVLPKPPTTSTGAADWGALIDQAKEEFSEVGGTNTTNILLIITDSIDCIGDECGGIGSSIVNQINELSLPANTIAHMLLTPFTTNATAFWNIYAQGDANVKQATTDFVSRVGGNLYVFENIDAMPLVLTQLLLSEVGRAKGRLNLPEDNILDVDAVNWSDIASNLAFADAASSGFSIPSYQAEGHFLTLLSQTIPNANFNPPRFYVEGNRQRPYDIETPWTLLGNTYQLRLASPPPEILSPLSSGYSVNGFVFYTPATPRVRIEFLDANQAVQYGQAQVVYELLNTDEIPFLQDEIPQLNAIVDVPNGDSFTLTNTQFAPITTTEGNPALRSEPIFLQNEGQYRVSIDAQLGEENDSDYEFLIPPDTSFNTQALTFYAQIGTDGNSSNLSLARDTALAIVVHAQVNGEDYPVPVGASASLMPFPIEGEACSSIVPNPTVFVVSDEGENERILQTSLEFRESGICRLDVQVRLEEVVYPLNKAITIAVTPELSRVLDVGATTRLTIGDLPTGINEIPDYRDVLQNLELAKLVPWAITGENAPFPSGEWILQVRFVNATGEDLIIPPEFEDAVYPNRDYCDNPNQNVPFTLEILDAQQRDQAREKGICLNNTDSRGVYLATITGLPAGDYTVNVRLDTQQMRLNRDIFSYDSTLTENGSIVVRPITLRVNPANDAQAVRIAIFASFGAIALALLISLRKVLISVYFSRRFPLHGTISILLANGARVKSSVIWEQKLPYKHTKVYSSQMFVRDMVTDNLRLKSLTVTTKKSRTLYANKQVEVIFDFGNSVKSIILDHNTEQQFIELDDDYYYVKHTLVGESSSSVEKI